MDYEKKYKNALEWARGIYPKVAGAFKEDLEHYFPELAEKNLDERIREVLIDFFKRYDETFYGISTYEVLAWVEKQGESSIHYWTEEEIEPIISDYLRGAEHYGGMIGRLRCLKPIDKVKPKTESQFKNGDWVINRTGDIIMQIVNTKGFYESVEIGGQRRTDTYNYLEWDFRLWDINDAKEGDVLISNDEMFIYAHRKQLYPIAVAHCFVDSDGGFYLDGEFGYSKEEGHSIHPATKEQRDWLFQKMHEAGYEWKADAKRIEPLAWTEEDDSMLECALDMVKWYIGRNETKCRSVSDWLKSLKGRIGG